MAWRLRGRPPGRFFLPAEPANRTRLVQCKRQVVWFLRKMLSKRKNSIQI